ncbi:MAG TPA: hypothetical protein VFL46_13860, partial [Phycicoccus sp.]|nr:hypothetical protein [Phycicoccus sp.]
LDGGPTDMTNAALLCQRHHTFVHTRRLVAQVRGRPDERGRYVTWDLTPGSYDQHLEKLRAEKAAHDPPPLTPERLHELVALVTGSEHPDPQVWAEHEPDEAISADLELADHELAEATLTWDTEPDGHDDDFTDEYWRDHEAQFDTAC